MFKTISVQMPLLAAVVLWASIVWGENQPTANHVADTIVQPPESIEGILATVNGVPIDEADIRFALSNRGHDTGLPEEHTRNVLEVIIGRELIRQSAVALGLDTNPGYQEKLRRMEAQINAFRREELSKLFWRDVARRTEISETEAKDYFAENAARIRTELHVWQILSREETSIQQARNTLDQGTSFEEAAAGRFPKLPKTTRAPWDLGYLRWKQVPEPWRDVAYNLKEGEVSGAIRGPNNRFWIIKLIDKRENPDITFESIRPTIMEVLKNVKIEKLRKQIEGDLRAKANIVYSQGPVETPEE